MPLLESLSARIDGLHETVRVQQVVVAAAVVGQVQVLAGEGEPQVPGEGARAVTPPTRVEGLAGIAGGVEDAAGQLAVVGPRAAVAVVAADADPPLVDHPGPGEDVDPRGPPGLPLGHHA